MKTRLFGPIVGTALVLSALMPQAMLAAIAQQAYLKASNTGVDDYFGYSVAVSGDTVVVGAKNEDSAATGVNGNQSDNSATNSGAAYVFVRSGTTWSQQAYLKASNTGAGDIFGSSVAVSGDTVVIGAAFEASAATGVNGSQSDNSAAQSGAAYVFVRTGTSWSQQAYLKASNTGANDTFGYSVAVSGDTVVVGASAEDSAATGVNGNQSDNSANSSGAAYVFVRSGTTWSQQAYLKASNTGAGDRFGTSVAVSGDTVVIGADGEDSNATGVNGNQSDNSAASAGAAYVFVRSGMTWSQQAYLKASNTDASDQFGYVAISGDTVVVVAPYEDSDATGVNGNQSDNSANSAGAAYVFVRSGTTWSQQAYLKASNTGADDYFGYSVAVSGDTVVVGASGEDSAATGVNGNQSDDSANSAGAAYVFVRGGTTWSQQAYLKASNTGAADLFGWSVALSGDTVVVGARFEASNATGVNGNQGDNSSSYAGAAYIFTGLGIGPTLNLAPDGSGGYVISAKGIADLTYRLQRAANLAGPWSSIATNTAPPSGLVEFHDLFAPPDNAFYRTAQP
jgi:trimeric autotransporter adhesin